MGDETAGVSDKEQLVICIRWVDNRFVVHEDFIGMHPLERKNADQVAAILKNALLRINLNIQRTRWQCYEGRRENWSSYTQFKATVMDMPQIWLSLMP